MSRITRITALALVLSARWLEAAPSTFYFAGVWRDQVLATDPIQPGNPFSGRFFYDPDAAVVTGQQPGSTNYAFTPGGAGIELNVVTATGIVRFQGSASAMDAQIVHDWTDGTVPPLDRFYFQSFYAAVFPPLYVRPFERLDIDILDESLVLLAANNGTVLPTTLNLAGIIPNINGYAYIGIQGGSTSATLDYNAAGIIQTVVRFAGRPGTHNCYGASVAGLQEFGSFVRAAATLGFPSVTALRDAVRDFCKT